MKSKYPRGALSSMCFCFQYDCILPRAQVLKGVSPGRRWKGEKIRRKHDVCAVRHMHYSTPLIQSNGSHIKKRKQKKTDDETWFCSSERSCPLAMVTCFQLVGRLMSDILRGPRLPLRPSLTEEQFICQRLPALLRYLIPPHCRRPAGPRGEHLQPHRSQIHQVGGRRRLLEGSETSVHAE